MIPRGIRRLWIAILVFTVGGIWFSFRASHAWLASGFMDPVGHFGAQDEAVYSRVVLEMVARGKWLVPTFLGRFAYFKPPLLYWLSAMSIAALGASNYTLRLPSVLAAAGTCAIAWSWVSRERGFWAALVTVMLIASDHYWVMMSSANMTDAPLVFFSLAAVWGLSRDVRIQSKWTLWSVAVCLAAAILTKSAAALIPALTVAVCARSKRVWTLLGLAIALASPWFIYTSVTHGEWFWDEHILTELIGNSIGTTPMSTPDSNLVFYASRLFKADPLISWIGVIALVIAIWKRTANQLVIVWLACNCVALLMFRYHAAPYLLPVVTALALTVGFALPTISFRWQVSAVCATALAAGLVLYKDQAIQWKGTSVASARALEYYCDLGRDRRLFILQPDDEYFSAVLPLRKVFYGVIDHGGPQPRLPINWRALGVVVTQEEFENQAKWWPIYQARLARMGLYLDHMDWHDPRGTAVLLHDEVAAADLIRAHPELDFLVPRAFARDPRQHDLALEKGDRVFLLSKMIAQHSAVGPPWSCRVGR